MDRAPTLPALALLLALLAGAPAAAQDAPALRATLHGHLLELAPPPAEGARLLVARGGEETVRALETLRSADRAIHIVWPRRLEAGDRLMLEAPDGRLLLDLVAPPIDVAYGPEGDELVGQVPGGATVRVQATYRSAGAPAQLQQDVLAGASGALSVPLPGAAAPGDEGRAEIRVGEKHRFGAAFVAPWSQVTLGERELLVGAPASAPVSAGQAAGADALGHLRLDIVPGTQATDPARDAREGRRGQLPAAVAAGQTITLSLGLPGARAPIERRLQVPALEMELDSARDRIAVQGPPGGALRLRLDGPGGTGEVLDAVLDGAGRWEQDLAGRLDLGAGWVAVAELDAGQGWRVRRVVSTAIVELSLHRGIVEGQAAEGAEIGIVSLDAQGRERGRWSTRAGAGGAFAQELVLEGAGPLRRLDSLEPGQTLLVDVTGGGDPLVFTLPDLRVTTEPERDRIAGVAPPGAALALEIWEQDQLLLRKADLRADAAGRFRVELGAEHDLQDGDRGRLVLRRPDGHRIRLDWVAPVIRVDMDTAGMRISVAPPSRRYDLRLEDASGAQRARLQGLSGPDAYRGAVSARLDPRDALDRPVAPRPGDRLVGRIGDEEIDLRIPLLEAVLDGRAQQLHGRSDAPAGTPLRMELRAADGRSESWQRPLDEDGRAVLDLAAASPAWSVQPNDRASLELRVPRGRINARGAAPGITLHLDGPRIELLLPPGARARIEQVRGGAVLAGMEVLADGAGAVDAALESAGAPWALRPGDELRLRPFDPLDGAETRLVVPAMSLELDPEENVIQGCASREDSADFRLNSTPGRDWTALLDWTGGCFTIDLDDHPQEGPFGGPPVTTRLVPGAEAELRTLRLSGHVVLLRRRLPRLHMHLGSAEVCVEADPRVPLALRVDGPDGAAAQGRLDAQGRARLRLQDRDGAAAPLRAGDVLRATVGERETLGTLPAFDVQADWSAAELLLLGVPGEEVYAEHPSRYVDCFGDHRIPSRTEVAVFHSWSPELDAAGEARIDVSRVVSRSGAPLAGGVVASHPSPEGHRAIRRLYPLQLVALLGTGHLSGLSGQGETVRAELQNERGTPLAGGEAVADAEGRFQLRLDGPDPRLDTGRRLLASSSSDAAELRLPPLDFDWSASSGLLGSTEPGRSVSVTLRIGDDLSLGFLRQADDAGTFRVVPSDLRPDEPWGLADVTGITTHLPVPPHHAVQRRWPADAPVTPAPTPTPIGPPPTPTWSGSFAYLPALLR